MNLATDWPVFFWKMCCIELLLWLQITKWIRRICIYRALKLSRLITLSSGPSHSSSAAKYVFSAVYDVFSTWQRDLLRRMSLKWFILCRMGRKTLVNQSACSDFSYCLSGRICWVVSRVIYLCYVCDISMFWLTYRHWPSTRCCFVISFTASTLNDSSAS